MTIELSSQLESALASEAARRGTTLQALAIEFIVAHLPSTPSLAEAPSPEAERPKTLYDRLKSHIGTVNSRQPGEAPSRLSEDTGRKFAAGLQDRRQQGRL